MPILSPTVSTRLLQTTQNQEDLNKIKKHLDDPGCIAIKAAKKISRAAEIFYARAVIAEHDSHDLCQEVRKIEEAASRKWKRVQVRVLVY
jgi:hypothetical protein